MRNDQPVQDAARYLFEGVAPERKDELKALWDRYSPRFNMLDDLGREGRFVLDAGLYREVRFNHRAVRVFWVASFAAWEGYRAVAQSVAEGRLDLTRFKALVDCVRDILAADDPEAVPLPRGIPQPGALLDARLNPQLRAAAELAHFAAGWPLLHEIRHLQHQQEGTGAGAEADRAARHAEELSCDAFATEFLLARVADYAREHQEDAGLVLQKRKIGVYFSFFAMTLVAKDRWGLSETHPALQDRIDAVMKISAPSLLAEAIGHLAFVALRLLWPEAPAVAWSS